ncbi:MAG: serine/threonine protein kinase [Planctomycetota bacterium]|nr:serine/threonine protein kinase [Planctomycetota bacterium]
MTQDQWAFVRDEVETYHGNFRFSPDDVVAARETFLARGIPEAECDNVLATVGLCIEQAKVSGGKPDPESFRRGLRRIELGYTQPRVICTLHGINTDAPWQRELSDLVQAKGWRCRLNRFYFGKFRIPQFLLPSTREARITWFRNQFDIEIHDDQVGLAAGQSLSVVAHSYGTYILGYALLRYESIRFNKVILCGSILPRDFPWDLIIERGQVQAVRNEFGVRDPWVKRVRGYVRGTGPSGALGFTTAHDRLLQQGFDYDHGDYFGRDHMAERWFPFLESELDFIPKRDGDPILRPPTETPWGLYIGLISLLAAPILSLLAWSLWGRSWGFVCGLLLICLPLFNVKVLKTYSTDASLANETNEGS